MSFSEKLRQLRKEQGMSQEQLAELLNVSRQSVSKWESGQTYPELDKLLILSDLFKISLDDLIKEKNININNINEKISEDKNDKIEDEYEDEDEERGEWLIIGGGILGMAISFLTDNYLFTVIGALIGLGLDFIIEGIKN